jgi:hypothetical protein
MVGSLNIHQDEIGALLCDRCKRLLAVLGLGDLVVGGSQHIADDLPIIRLLALDPAWSVTIVLVLTLTATHDSARLGYSG